AQKLPAELETQQQAFLNFIQYRRIQYDYPLPLIGNMDETPLAFDMPSNVTIDTKGNKTISIRTCGYEKSCFTVVLACMADGRKLPPMIIFKLKNVPRLEFPQGVIIRANEKGWMNEMEMNFWVEKIWQNRTPSSENPQSLL
ncbi:13801_t:CDS:1, partial [Dentiscutata erythropus]